MKVFQIVGPNGTKKHKDSFYKTLHSAKIAARLHVKNINKKGKSGCRDELVKYSDYKIIEYELIQKCIHPI